MNKIISIVIFTLLSALPISFNTYANPSTEQRQMLTVNINNADVEELVQLKGIGEVKAKAIVSYRNDNGNFSSLDELLNVKGIGEKVLSENLAKISI